MSNIVKNKKIDILTIIFLSVISLFVLYIDRYTASNFVIIPDSTEYALAAHRFVTSGEYKILVDGHWRPPRYPPWFSVLIIAPAYIILGLEPGNAIYSITFFGILGILIAFFIGKKVGGYIGGVAASLLVLALPIYRIYSKYVMTDIPTTVLIMLICAFYMAFKNKKKIRSSKFLIPGVLLALCASLRPICGFAILPFIIMVFKSYGIPKKVKMFIYLLSPLFFITITTFIYNYTIFESISRTGYHFWTSVPYDYPYLTFSYKYIPVNIIVLWKSKIFLFFLIYVLFILLGFKISSDKEKAYNDNCKLTKNYFTHLLEFTLFAAGPTIVFYLLYFYPTPRFYLPVLVLSAITIGGIIGKLFDRTHYLALLSLFILIIISQFIMELYSFNTSSDLLKRRATVNEILAYTPENSWIISSIEPAYIEYLLGENSKRRVVPISRNIEYADKLITHRKIPSPQPPPKNWRDSRCPGLIKGGAEEAIKIVASEQLDLIAQKIALGHPVFLTTANIPQQDIPILKELEKRFNFVEYSKNLIELKKR
ncbi:MAG: hypothetical protein QXJ06_01765 [Candidatus Aenigmatarchaeota archaeon]